MRYLPLVCLLLGTLAWGQQKPAPPTVPPEYGPPVTSEHDDLGHDSLAHDHDNDEQEAEPASASKVAPDAPVVTIKGLCAQTPPSATSASASNTRCETVITRAQFEQLTEAILTNMKPAMKRQIAEVYPNLLAMAHEAEVRGLENSPRFRERIAFARVQILSQELIRQIGEETANVPEKDIEEYYRRNLADFEKATLERVFVPNRKRMTSPPKEQATPQALKAQQKESEDEMNRVAEELRTKAAAGEDFMTLQKEAYAAAGATDVPPNPSLGQLQSSSLPSNHVSAFELKPGEVSQVLSDATGHYIYKLDAKRTEPLEEVTNEIRKVLQNQHREQVIQAVKQPISTQINEAYFGPIEKKKGRGSSKSK
jgi:hypothetical protein